MITKKLLTTAVWIGLFTAYPTTVNGQFWKKIKKRIESKAEDKVLDKVDEKTDKTLDEALEKKPKKATKTKSSKSNYFFKGSVTVEVSNETNETAEFNVLFNEDSDVFCMHMSVDKTNQIYNVITPSSAISFMDVGGMKFKKQVDDLNFDNTDKLPNKEGDFVKTGNTKNILGYICSEYLYKHERGSARVWVTKKFPIKSNYAPLLGMTKNSKIKGFVLELDYESNSGEKAMVKVTKIEKDKNVKINSANYKSMF
ncbi:hypothetical protein ACOSP6_05740 [Tenacibaculum sp. MEBiC06402]|uniref:hypothetical protein n=1 Tax=unclassified Tenacibaculum TaxID=2635139 RepID=UPI003B9BA4B3